MKLILLAIALAAVWYWMTRGRRVTGRDARATKVIETAHALPSLCHINVTVTCAGAPCPGLPVLVADRMGSGGKQVGRTDAEGRCLITCHGDRLVRVVAAESPARVVFEQVVHFSRESGYDPYSLFPPHDVVAPFSSTAEVNFDLPPLETVGSLSGRLLVEEEAVAAGTIRVETRAENRIRQTIEARIDGNGHYVLTHVPCRTLVLDCEYASGRARVHLDVAAPGGHEHDIELTAPRSLSGLVEGVRERFHAEPDGAEESTPVGDGAKVMALFERYPTSTDVAQEAIASNAALTPAAWTYTRDGHFCLENLQPGRYRIHVVVDEMRPIGDHHCLGGFPIREAQVDIVVNDKDVTGLVL